LLTIRKNLVAWLALFFALTGTGIAASRYVITTTHQIKPSVLRKLRGQRGEPGPQGSVGPSGSEGKEGSVGPRGLIGTLGPTGATGAPGPQGERGPQGEQGAEGKAGSVGPQGPEGAIGPDGQRGPEGPPGERGPQGEPAVAFYAYHGAALELRKETHVVGLKLPGGTYLVHSTVNLRNLTTVTAFVICHLEATNSSVGKRVLIGPGESETYLHPGRETTENGGPGGSTESVALEGAFEGNWGTGFESSVYLICDASAELYPVDASDASISAIKIEQLTEH
jgi:Collagen triple helix repeat (20 copies)